MRKVDKTWLLLNGRVDENGTPKIVQIVHWDSGWQWFEIYLFNGLKVYVERDDFPACERAMFNGVTRENGENSDRRFTLEFINLMYDEADVFIARHPHLKFRDDLPQPVNSPLALVPMEDY